MLALISAATLSINLVAQANTNNNNADVTAKYFKLIQNDPNALLIFLQNMPKGGDLHNHRAGAAYAENMLAYATNDGMCVDPTTLSVTANKNCSDANNAKGLPQNSALYNQLINAWSMRNFVTSPQENAHDHFFNTFLKFLPVSSTHRAENLTEIVNRAGTQHEEYLETMITAGTDKAMAIGEQVGWHDNFDTMRQQLDAHGIPNVADSIAQELNQNEAYMQKTLQCGTAAAQPGCNVTVRYQYISLRNLPPAQVFAQLLTGFELANKDSRVVAINIVAPEDDYYALLYYHLQMQMINYLHQAYPNVHIDLHAGELAPGLVTPEQLTFHIREAVEIGHAERIGHGVDIANEKNAKQLLAEMKQKGVAVEVCLTSNSKILNMWGYKEPFLLYLQTGVPVVLATDDEGVLRTSLTREFQRAILTYHIDYPTVKALIRNSLTYNFMPGKSLWQNPSWFVPVDVCTHDQLGNNKPSSNCAAFLQANPKAALQWKLESDFNKFETQIAQMYRAQMAVQ
jgi:adenosine deaminase